MLKTAKFYADRAEEARVILNGMMQEGPHRDQVRGVVETFERLAEHAAERAARAEKKEGTAS